MTMTLTDVANLARAATCWLLMAGILEALP